MGQVVESCVLCSAEFTLENGECTPAFALTSAMAIGCEASEVMLCPAHERLYKKQARRVRAYLKRSA